MEQFSSPRSLSLECASDSPWTLGDVEARRLSMIEDAISIFDLEAKLRAAQESLKRCYEKVQADQKNRPGQHWLQGRPSGCELRLARDRQSLGEDQRSLQLQHKLAKGQALGREPRFQLELSQGKDPHHQYPEMGSMFYDREQERGSKRRMSQKEDQPKKSRDHQRELQNRSNPPLQLDEHETALITAQIRERERKRLARKLQVEARNMMAVNIGDLDTFDDAAIFFTPKEWKEWKQVEQLLQMDAIKGNGRPTQLTEPGFKPHVRAADQHGGKKPTEEMTNTDVSSVSQEKDPEKNRDGQKAGNNQAVRRKLQQKEELAF